MKQWHGLGILGLATAILASCGGGGERGGHLLEGKKPSVDEEAEQIRLQHKIHVYFTPSGSTTGAWYEVTQQELISSFEWGCHNEVPNPTTCEYDVYQAGMDICIYQNILNVMQVGAQPFEKVVGLTAKDGNGNVVLNNVTGTVSIPRQTVATVATLADYLFANKKLVADANKAFTDCSAGPASELKTSTWVAEEIVADTKTAYELTEQMTDIAVKNIVAAADGTRSSAPPGLGADQQSWTQPVLSRSAAAMLIAGGKIEDHGYSSGFCPGRPLAAQEKKAVDLLRSSGVSVDELDEKVQKESTATLLPLVGRRLSTINGDANLALAASSSAGVLKYFSLEESDFTKARQYLVAESDAFGRDRSLKSGTIKDPSGGNFDRYVATTMPSTFTPNVLYAALASPPNLSISTNSLAAAEYLAVSTLKNLNDFISANSSSYTDARRATLLESQASALMKISANLKGVLQFANINTGLNQVQYNVPQSDDTRPRRMVQGETGLNCALTGNTGAGPCTSSDLDGFSTKLTQDSGSRFLFSSGVGFSGSTGNLLNSRYYIVTPKVGTSGNPGDYEVELGFIPGVSSFSGVAAIGDTSLQDAVVQVLRPSESWCNMPRQSCAGASFDERLPLEDELTSDSDGVESSWKHYLNLAKDAATQSDSLGQDFVNASLQYDQKISDDERNAEQRRQALNTTLETLQDTCGTNLDMDKVTKLLFGQLGAACTSSSQCTGNGACVNSACRYSANTCTSSATCATGQSCVAGFCMADLQKVDPSGDADIGRLKNCLSDQTQDFVALGDRALCLVVDPSNPGDYCPSNIVDSDFPCPRQVDADGTCKTYSDHYGKTAVPPPVTTVLNLFKTSAPPPSDQADLSCAAITAARNQQTQFTVGDVTYNDPIAQLALSNWLEPTDFVELAKRVGFESRFGSYGAVTLDETPIYSTGSLNAPSKVWPCKAATSVVNGLFDSTVLCEAADPTSTAGVVQAAAERGNMNDRLLRAVIMLRYVAGLNDKGIKVPLYVPRPDSLSIDSTFSYDANGSGVQIGGTDYASIYVHEARTGVEGDRTRIYFNDQRPTDYPVSWTLQSGESVSPLYFQQTINGQTFQFGIGETNSELTASSRVVSQGTCCGIRLGGMIGFHYGCSACNQVTEQVDRVSAASWLYGLYNTTATIASSDQGLNATGWYKQALQNWIGNVQPPSLPGHIEFSSSPQLAFGLVPFDKDIMFDALELACHLRGASTNSIAINLSSVPTVGGPQDFPLLNAYLQAIANRIDNWASTFILAHVSAEAVDFSRDASKAGAFPKLGGSYATAVTALRGSLVSLSSVSPLMAEEVRRLGTNLQQASIAMAQADNNYELDSLQKEADNIQRTTQCISAIASAGSLDPVSAAGSVVAAAAQCAAAAALQMIGDQMLNIQAANVELSKQQALVTLQQQVSQHAVALQQYAKQVSEALESIDGQLAEIERQRLKAKRAAAEALRQLSFENAASQNVTSDMAAIRETARIRYENAFDVAKRTAFLARRAIEQRLGVNMDELTNDMPLVEAPQRWVGTVCERTGIDWNAVRTSNPNTPVNFADSFIGDYVSKLDRVVESYRLDHNFHEGSDTSVISLRDDVLNVRQKCDVPVDNLLYYTDDISVTGNPGDLMNVWRPYGCNTRTDTNGKTYSQNCIVPAVADVASNQNISQALADKDLFKDFGIPRPFNLVYGIDDPNQSNPCGTGNCDFTNSTGWAQRIHLGAGRYRLSWYSTLLSNGYLSANVNFTPVIPNAAQTSSSFVALGGASTDFWRRAWYLFDVSQETDIDIVVSRSMVSNTKALVAGPMVEDVSTESVDPDPRKSTPKPFAATTNVRTRRIAACQDTSGAEFRKKWVKKCVPLCPDGFAGTCNPSAAVTQCFWEVPFSITQRAIEAGQAFKLAGFAQGNFNYRISSVGVNAVGTGVKNCASSLLPSTCYSSGNITYSIDHEGPYTVRNYAGADYDAKLFTGHIEHARGLAAERYITNPISSTDQQLMDQYMRTELQGRPLDGNFVLRIWDDPNTAFDGVQDIQIVLKYSYWTRFD